MRKLTLGSLFDGSGGFALGGILSGINPIWASEIEPFPIRVTSKRLPSVQHLGDINQIDGAKITPVDIITFGSPCTDMSLAGRRAGLVGSQSVLFYQAIRIIKEMRNATDGKYPRYIVWENVPGAFSSNKGEDFKAVLEAICKIKTEDAVIPELKEGKWSNAGRIVAEDFSLAWRVFDAQYWGVPQRRKRIYLVADFAGRSAGEILFESEGLSGYSKKSRNPWQKTAGGTETCTGETGTICLNDQGGERMDVTEDKTSTLRDQSNHPPLVFENHSQDSRFVGPLDKAQTVLATFGTGGNNQPFVMETPIPFDEYDLPSFPIDTLPKAIGDYAAALSESTQTPVDMAATAAIAVLSVCMQGKFKIRAKADWIEPVNTFVLDVMNPSERKSAVENAMLRPLNLFEAERNTQNSAAIESSKMQKRILERRQKVLEDQASKGKADAEEVRRIAEEIAGYKEMKPMKLYVDDITTEKLTSVLAGNDGRAAILSTEGGIFDTLAGAYSKTVNIDVMLKGYSGDSIRVDRIGRNSESIMNPALTVLLMVQPSVLSGLMQNGTFRGRGLTARFLYCIPASFVGKRRYRSEPVPEEIYREYELCIRNLLEDECGKEAEIITLSDEADAMIEMFAERLEPELNRGYADIVDWAGKLVGNIQRIAALLCRASIRRSHDFLDVPEPLVVDGQTMSNAIKIGEYFIEHAKAAFMLMGADPVISQSKKVVEVVKENGLTEFTRRDIMRLCRNFKKAEDVQQVLTRLTDYGYIASKDDESYSGKGRPPAQTYLVNPHIYEQ